MYCGRSSCEADLCGGGDVRLPLVVEVDVDELAGLCGFAMPLRLGDGMGCSEMSKFNSADVGKLVVRASMTEMRKSGGPGAVLRK